MQYPGKTCQPYYEGITLLKGILKLQTSSNYIVQINLVDDIDTVCHLLLGKIPWWLPQLSKPGTPPPIRPRSSSTERLLQNQPAKNDKHGACFWNEWLVSMVANGGDISAHDDNETKRFAAMTPWLINIELLKKFLSNKQFKDVQDKKGQPNIQTVTPCHCYWCCENPAFCSWLQATLGFYHDLSVLMHLIPAAFFGLQSSKETAIRRATKPPKHIDTRTCSSARPKV